MGRLPARFVRWVVIIAPREQLAYEAADWVDALVVLQQGTLLLDRRCGESYVFRCGDFMCLADLALVALRNDGAEPAVLVAVARCR